MLADAARLVVPIALFILLYFFRCWILSRAERRAEDAEREPERPPEQPPTDPPEDALLAA